MKKLYLILSFVLISFIANASITGQAEGLCPNDATLYNSSYTDSDVYTWKWIPEGGTIRDDYDSFSSVWILWNDSNTTHKVTLTVKQGTKVIEETTLEVRVKSIKTETPGNFSGDFNIPFGDNTPRTYSIPSLKYPNCFSTLPVYVSYYEWLIPAGWIHNNDVSDGKKRIKTRGTSITVIPDDCTDGSIKVRGVTECSGSSNSRDRKKEITGRNITPLVSSTDFIVCGKPKEITLNIGSVPNATYQWTKPASWTWTSGTNSNVVKVMPDGFSGGTISVIVDGCTSLKESKIITLKDWDPNEPTPKITGAKVLCTGGGTYSLQNAYSNATSVTWSVSPSNLVEKSTGSGASAFLKAIFFKIRGAAEIKFTLHNQCGKIYEVKYNVWVGPPSGSEILCRQRLVGLHSIIEADALSPGATYYNWSVDGGSIQYAQNTSHVVVATGSTCLTNLCLRVSGENACGSGIYAYKYIPMDCSGPPSPLNSFNPDPLIVSKVGLSEEGNSKQLADTQMNLESTKVITSIAIFPNPVEDVVNIQIPGNLIVDNNFSIEIYNSTGKLLLRKELVSNTNSIDLSNSPSGTYIVKLITDQEIITKKIIKK
ncbi:T9SS type A sorting domain-containing protein [Labilibaculum manganireducens]|uniref:T9SS type A sorting domain-containing protein n=1 Tax=Labilibaculum manganireducens TaxID=1940525 RepID=UPI0029F4E6CE|nr:T9SS type A sorting domain-containing protein [Labilibaculum manganireducens]